MYFKKLSQDKAVYRQPRLAKLLLALLCGFFLAIGLLNVSMSAKADSLPIWVSGFICWLGWSGTFGGYVCRFDLSAQTIQLKASSLYTIFNRVYALSNIKGFRAMPSRGVFSHYRVYAVLNDDTHVAIANYKARARAIDDCKQMADFVGKPHQISIAPL